MVDDVGHTGGLTNPRPWRGRCRADYSNTGGPPLASKEGAFNKKMSTATINRSIGRRSPIALQLLTSSKLP